jgi:hypothetical protein
VPSSDPRRAAITEELTRAADHHGIVTSLYRAYARGDVTATDGAALTDLARLRRADALRITASAPEVSDWLRLARVRHVIVKGPALAVAYEDVDREFVDLDVLVAPSQMRQAITTLEEHGARLLENVPWPRPDGNMQLAVLLGNRVTLDLHAHLVNDARVRRDFCLPTEALLDRATTVAILNRQLPVLDPEDTVIHVALHAIISGGDRLVWLADLDGMVRRNVISWPRLLLRARSARASLVVGVMLERASMVLGTPVPQEALGALQRRGAMWARLLRSFERWRPTAANYGRSFRGQVLMRATRDRTTSSLVTLSRLMWTDVVLSLLRDPHHPWRARIGEWCRGGWAKKVVVHSSRQMEELL